jgi:chemosensory pili system protein ChpA (sensor histidine kinase/response regulator)
VAGESAYDEIPLVSLAALLGIEEDQHLLDMGLVVDVGRQRVALLVDDVLGDQEVVVQALPAHLRRRAVRGATVTSDGHVLLLLDLPELVSGMLEGTVVPRRHAARATPPVLSTLAPRVLVVDDSISIRRTLEQTLTRAGFEVELARDGIEALDRMLVSAPRVVVLDIEMPRLDGYELLTILRDTPQFADVRVVMLTSRAAEKHREHALQLGARAYLVKPCPQDTLIATVRGLLEELPSPA